MQPVRHFAVDTDEDTEERLAELNETDPKIKERFYTREASADAEGDETELEEGYYQPVAPGRRRDGTYYQGQWENRDGLEPPYRQPRPYLKPIRDLKARQIPALREHPMAKEAGGLLDIIEHEVYSARIGDGDSGGGFHDFTFAPWDDESMEDPFYNGAITEDEYEYKSDHELYVHVPDGTRTQVYYLWKEKGWSIPDLAAKFKMRSERVSMIINLKRTEPALEAEGLVAPELDKAMSMMFARGEGRVDADYAPDHSHGLHGAVLRDAQLPEDSVPRLPWRGNILKTGGAMPKLPRTPKDQRVFKSRLAVRDISAGQAADAMTPPKCTKSRIFDYDGVRRPSTKLEDMYRTGRARRWEQKRHVTGSMGMPFDDEAAHSP